MTGTHRWTHRPEGANWGDFGPGDQICRRNLLGPEAVLRGDIKGVAARKLAIETMAATGVQSRSVLIDLDAAA